MEAENKEEKKIKERKESKEYQEGKMNFWKTLKEKIEANEELSKKELKALYGVESPIEGWTDFFDDIRDSGFQHFPSWSKYTPLVIGESKINERNKEKDIQTMFKCTREQIAYNINEVNENIKIYIGEWNPEVMKKIPANVEHLYESFPDEKILRKTIEITEKNPEEYDEEIKKIWKSKTSGLGKERISEYLNKDTKNKKEGKTVKIVSFTRKQLGLRTFTSPETENPIINEKKQLFIDRKEVLEKAKSFGLKPCERRVPLEYCLDSGGILKETEEYDFFVEPSDLFGTNVFILQNKYLKYPLNIINAKGAKDITEKIENDYFNPYYSTNAHFVFEIPEEIQ